MHENLLFIKHTLRLSRIWNAFTLYLSYGLSLVLRRPIVWGLPTVLMIEPTNLCNLKCPLCPTGAGTLRRHGSFMDFELYSKVIDEVWNRTFMILLWNQGESFMNKDFLRMVRYAADRGLWTYGSTNGHYLEDPEAVVRSGLGTLLVSVDGASATTYEAYRRSGNFEQVIGGLKGLVQAKRRLKSATPVIHLQFIIMRHNEHEIPAITRLAQECGVDRLTLKTVQIYDDADIPIWLPDNLAQSRYQVIESDGEQHFALKGGYKNRCQKLWNQPVVNAGGEIAVCCFDKDVDFPMGNMKQQGFREVWRSSRYQQFRAGLMENRSRLEMCRNCGEGVKLFHEQKDIHVDLSRTVDESTVARPDEKELAERIKRNIDSTLERITPSDPARTQEQEARLKAAQQARPRTAGSREQRRSERTGVAGLSLGHGPLPIEELEALKRRERDARREP
ncbi:MAG: SPASM domain-containing protein [Candidatus Cloacimonetes bacterium]|nr:SPASM domain-containing protein [Candidatus Cloacimonadota bacterium]